MGIGGIFVILKIFEKGIPKLINRKKKEWEAEQKKDKYKKADELNIKKELKV